MFGRGDTKRSVAIKKNKRGLYCVKTQADSGAKRAFKGASMNRFMGCFRSKAAAEERAEKVARQRTLK